MLMNQWIRIFTSDNGTLTDVSLESSNAEGFTVPEVAAEDYVYIGQYFPFNNVHIEMGSTVNAEASAMSVQYWSNQEWTDTVDIIDGTKSSGATLAQAGVVQYSPDRRENWKIVQDTTEGDYPPELSTLELYNLYWMRIKFSADLTAGTEIKSIGYQFCDDAALTDINPEINDFLTSWEAGKTNWRDQIAIATRYVIADLKSRGLIVHAGNVLRFDDYYFPTAYRTLINIYSELGENYADKVEKYEKNYSRLLEIQRHTVDRDSNARVSRAETSNVATRGIR